jgi:RimJ/RimL family protein N-acetyltransferase
MSSNSRLRSTAVQLPRHRIAWPTPSGLLLAVEPHREEVAQHARVLAAAYNDPHNASLLGHTEPITERDVIVHYESLRAAGGHGFLVLRDGALVGDADLRGIAGGDAEFAFLVAAVAEQGKGLGTRLATMVHAFAFARRGIERIYASIIPRNTASRRVFEKLGYAVDAGPAARAYADDPGDVTMVIERAAFLRSHAPAMAEIQIAVR